MIARLTVIAALVCAVAGFSAGRAQAISGCGGWFIYGSNDIVGAQTHCSSYAGPGTQQRVKVWCWNPIGATIILYGQWVPAGSFSTQHCPHGGALNFTVQTR